MSAVTLLGLPGAGKGTQVVRIGERLSIPVISTGEISRSNMAEGMEIGKQAKSYMDRGEFAPDSATNVMVKACLSAPDATQGFLLDGYPRNVEQVRVFVDFCEELGTHIGVALEIQVDEDEVVVRMLKRTEEQYRADDSESMMRHCLEAYREQTKSIASFYAGLDLLETVDGSGSIDEVSERISMVLDAHSGR